MQRIIGILLWGIMLAACGGDTDHQHNGAADGRTSMDGTGAQPAGSSGSISGVPGEVAATFENMLDQYLHLTDILVESDAGEAARQGGQLRNAAERLIQIQMSDELAAQLEQPVSAIMTSSELISQEGDVEEQRKLYEGISLAMISLVEKLGHQKDSLYHQRCPMVNGGDGDWLSSQERILNPYHGNRMLHCGTTVREM